LRRQVDLRGQRVGAGLDAPALDAAAGGGDRLVVLLVARSGVLARGEREGECKHRDGPVHAHGGAVCTAPSTRQSRTAVSRSGQERGPGGKPRKIEGMMRM